MMNTVPEQRADMNEFNGKRVLVTGGTKGVGKAIADRFQRGGATVIITARSAPDENPDEKLRLTHIAEAAALVADYLKGVSKEAFLNDGLRLDAVIRASQINGEASRHVSG